MRTVNISDYFPVTDDETLERYLRKDDQYEGRKNQLAHLLAKCIPTDPKKLSNALLKGIFDPAYRATHRWPTIK